MHHDGQRLFAFHVPRFAFASGGNVQRLAFYLLRIAFYLGQFAEWNRRQNIKQSHGHTFLWFLSIVQYRNFPILSSQRLGPRIKASLRKRKSLWHRWSHDIALAQWGHKRLIFFKRNGRSRDWENMITWHITSSCIIAYPNIRADSPWARLRVLRGGRAQSRVPLFFLGYWTLRFADAPQINRGYQRVESTHASWQWFAVSSALET